jgi:exopolysaccharide biosynthesis WecB/TagA/CpsF family protein
MKPVKIETSLVDLDDYDLPEAANHILSLRDQSRFSYVVTPNIDHLSRLCDTAADMPLAQAYQQSDITLCDSRILEKLLSLSRKPVKAVVPGSDLTQYVFDHVIRADDHVVVFGCDESEMASLYHKYSSLNITHISPSMGFIKKDDEVAVLIDRLKAEKADYIFLAVGSPQQEIFAYQLKMAGLDRGVALCVGASINFIVGVESRAPVWMQHLRIEWFYRMVQSPLRLVKRYSGNVMKLPTIYSRLRQ